MQCCACVRNLCVGVPTGARCENGETAIHSDTLRYIAICSDVRRYTSTWALAEDSEGRSIGCLRLRSGAAPLQRRLPQPRRMSRRPAGWSRSNRTAYAASIPPSTLPNELHSTRSSRATFWRRRRLIVESSSKIEPCIHHGVSDAMVGCCEVEVRSGT